MIQIIGKGGFARELAAYLFANGHETMMFENECTGMRPSIGAVIAIGDEDVREDVDTKFYDQAFTTAILARVYGSDCKFGEGCMLCPGTIVTTNVHMGRHCLVNLNCTIGHDCRIGDFVTMNPGVNMSGNVTVGDNVAIGSNAVIRQKISICSNVVIGAGAVVVKDITEPGVYVGNPAKLIKKIETT